MKLIGCKNRTLVVLLLLVFANAAVEVVLFYLLQSGTFPPTLNALGNATLVLAHWTITQSYIKVAF